MSHLVNHTQGGEQHPGFFLGDLVLAPLLSVAVYTEAVSATENV